MNPSIPAEAGLAIHLVSKSEGPLEREHLALVEQSQPRLTPGSVLVRNLCAAIDPHPTAPAVRRWPLHQAVQAGSLIGQVIASRSSGLPQGTLIAHREGWATHSVLPGVYIPGATSECGGFLPPGAPPPENRT